MLSLTLRNDHYLVLKNKNDGTVVKMSINSKIDNGLKIRHINIDAPESVEIYRQKKAGDK